MVRTALFSLVGAGGGFLAGFLVILLVLEGQGGGEKDLVPISVFAGIFLAGAAAIAGAVIGGVADLLAYFRTKERALREMRATDRPA